MIDINLIRNDPEWVKAQVARRGDSAPIDEIVALDKQRRAILIESEELRKQRNVASKDIGRLMGQLKKLEKQGSADEVAEMKKAVEAAKDAPRVIGEQIAVHDEKLRTIEGDLRNLMLTIPNILHDSVPEGLDETANVHHDPQGAPARDFDFTPKPHWELGVDLDIIDFDRGTKVSGSRFYMLKGWGARLQRAVIQMMLDTHTQEHGFTEIMPPFMVHSNIFEGAGQLPKFFDNIYRDAEEDFMMLGTAEIVLTGFHRDEILDEAELPKKYVSHTPCFRREKMSAGKDVRGIKRGHQFDKVEVYQYVHPDNSYAVLEDMKQYAINICEKLGFRYKILDLAAGDVGFSMTKTYDIEVWAPGCDEWLEVSSISNAGDFQARRSNIRFRPSDGGKNQIPHTLNASGLALPRVMIAIMENYQQADGSIVIPEVLRAYMGGAEVIPAG